MCRKALWSPVAPCCGDASVCKFLPRIDWTKWTWLVEHDAATVHIAIDGEEWRNGQVIGSLWQTDTNFIEGWFVPENEPFASTDNFGAGQVLWGRRKYLYRSGRYLAQHNGACTWKVFDLEELWPMRIGVLWADKLISGAPEGFGRWNIGALHIVPAAVLQYWEDLTVATGVDVYVSWRDILKYAECSMIPSLRARSDILQIAGDVLEYLTNFRTQAAAGRLHDFAGSQWLYEPSVLDIAAAFALSPGLLFGIVTDKTSPLFGQFTIFEGATYVGPTLTASAWELQDGPVTDTLGVTWTFHRTADLDWLPDVATLKLVRK